MSIRQIATCGALSAVCFSVAAHACTVCDSTTGRQVRAGLFNGHFTRTVGLVALPSVLLCVAVAGVYFGMPDLEGATAEEQARDVPVLTAPKPHRAFEAKR
jgi:hypothetical protein